MTMNLKGNRICWSCEARKWGFMTPRDLLYHWYIEQDLSTAQMGERVGLTKTAINAVLRYFGFILKNGHGGPRAKNV